MVIKSPAVVLIPSLMKEGADETQNPERLAPDFEPIHPLAQKLRRVLNNPERSTIGDMADLVARLMGELRIMGSVLRGPPPPQPMSPPAAGSGGTDLGDWSLTDEEKTELGSYLMTLTPAGTRSAP
jgi:hypothetical protein